jgi:hypothetical protein
LAVLVVQFCWVTQGNAAPTLLDFEELRINDSAPSHQLGPSYSRDRLQITTVQRTPAQLEEFNYPGTLSSVFVGSTTLFHHIGGGKIILSRIDGSLFDLISIDIAELPTIDGNGQPVDFGSFDITFIGTRADTSTLSETFTAQSFPRVTTFQFSDFSGLVFVHWFQGGGGGPGLQTHQFDNVLVEVPSVPEPGDNNGDGVPDDADLCPDTVFPESVPTEWLGVNRFALTDDDAIFDTTRPKGEGPRTVFTLADTAGCSCAQIIEALGLGEGDTKFGCSSSAMREWTEMVHP